MVKLPKLNLPQDITVKLKKINKKILIFDHIRLKYLIFTLEEYVRQSLILYFIIYKNYERSSFIIEKKININNTIKRVDIILINQYTKILIECKSPKVNINQKIFEQVARYNLAIQAKKILISNGINHFDLIFNDTKKMYLINQFHI